MASNNHARFVSNAFGATDPLVMLGLFKAGSTSVVKAGEVLELSNTKFVPLNADQSNSATIAIANEEIKDGDRAGYYEIIVPRPGDIFDYALNTASNPSVGASLYWISSESFATSGSQAMAQVAGQTHYPLKQGHLADDASSDTGTTIRSVSRVQLTFKLSVSYYLAIFK